MDSLSGRRAEWTTVGSGTLRVDHFGLSLFNSYNVLSELDGDLIADINRTSKVHDNVTFKGETVWQEYYYPARYS